MLPRGYDTCSAGGDGGGVGEIVLVQKSRKEKVTLQQCKLCK